MPLWPPLQAYHNSLTEQIWPTLQPQSKTNWGLDALKGICAWYWWTRNLITDTVLISAHICFKMLQVLIRTITASSDSSFFSTAHDFFASCSVFAANAHDQNKTWNNLTGIYIQMLCPSHHRLSSNAFPVHLHMVSKGRNKTISFNHLQPILRLHSAHKHYSPSSQCAGHKSLEVGQTDWTSTTTKGWTSPLWIYSIRFSFINRLEAINM